MGTTAPVLPDPDLLGLAQSLMKLAGLDWQVLGVDAAMLEIRAIEVTNNATGDAPIMP